VSSPTGAAVPSEPVSANELFRGYPVFENVRRPTVGSRRCSPADNSFVAIDRAIAKDRFALLFRRAHPCLCGNAIAEDLSSRVLGLVGLDPLDAVSGSDGHVDVLISGCPGVRLRTLAEKSAQERHPIAAEVAWHLVRRTAALVAAWARAGIAPGDTFIAFDGSIHLFPRMVACARQEAPSYLGDEVWDSFVVDADPASLDQLICGSAPVPYLLAARDAAFRAAGIRLPTRKTSTISDAVRQLLARPPTSIDATGHLADLLRLRFPAVYERHRSLYAQLGLKLEDEGQAREARVLAGVTLTSPG
jgi:hypothetical protein